MKTINEIARAAGMSRQTLYRILEKENVSLDDVTTEKHGTTRLFDDAAEKELVTLLQRARKNKSDDRDKRTTDSKIKADNERLQREAEQLRRELEELRRERDKLTEKVNSLDEERRVMLGTIATQAKSIEGYRQEHETARITDGAAAEGWIRRAWRRITGKGAKE